MKIPRYIIIALTYVNLIIITEVGLYYFSSYMNLSNNVMMISAAALLMFVAWLLKPTFASTGLACTLIVIYGVVSYLVLNPVYFTGYPDEFSEFASVLGIKSMFYSSPIIIYVALTFGNKKKIT